MRERPHKYIPGDHLMVCDECGLTYRRSEVKKRWDGAMVCKKDWEPKHPQENVRVRVDRVAVDHARPEGSKGNLIPSAYTVGDGWEETGNGLFTCDGTESAIKTVIFPAVTTDASRRYNFTLNVVSTDEAGSVRLYIVSSLAGTPATAETYIGWNDEGIEETALENFIRHTVWLQSKEYFNGVVFVSMNKIYTGDDL